MTRTSRIEIRYRPGIYDVIAEKVHKDIRDLGFRDVKEVDYIEVYTISGKLKRSDIKTISGSLLADPVSQEYNCARGFKYPASKNVHSIEIAYNPGVMDPVRESAVKAISDMGFSVDTVKASKKYVLKGRLSGSQVRSIADRLLYNKIIQHVVKPDESGAEVHPYVFKRIEVDILGSSDRELAGISRDCQLYLSLEEMRAIKGHFLKIGRNPTDCELETIAQTWSEHCKHKTMMGDINYNGRLIKNLLKNTVMKATRELKRPWCVSVFEDNAGIIKFDAKHNICFKVETHNHPSALEPYGGAETGIGGVIRDTLGTGRGAKPVANTDIFCFGIPDYPASKIPKGALHPKRVMKGVVSGVRDYGNKMGIPTVNGSVFFDERYTGNPLVFCGNIGIMPAGFSSKKVTPGDLIVVVGGKTGRDGIHGATFSSAELTVESESISSTAVQIGDPITEKKMVDTLLRARDMRLYEAVTDCGAGGFSSAVGEMGERTGAEVHLERAPLKYAGLRPWEIWISEAQERMVLAVRPEKLRKLMKVFREEDVDAVVIGRFTDDKRLRIYYRSNLVADLDMRFLHDGIPRQTRTGVWKDRGTRRGPVLKPEKNYNSALKKILSSWNVCSKEWIIRQYDHEVQGGSVLKPLIGVDSDGPSDAAIIRPILSSRKGIVISNGMNPLYGDLDPYNMAASAIDEALRQIIAVGGDIDRVALLDNFCWGNTEKKEQLGKLVRASQACYDMAKVFRTPFISGKDSLNNEFNTGKKTVSIPSTLLISAIGVIDDAGKSVSSDIKEPGNLIYVLGNTGVEMGGSHYFLINGLKGGKVPGVDPFLSKKIMEKLSKAIQKGYVRSAHDCSEGGLAVCVAEMLFSGGLGADVALGKAPRKGRIASDAELLFSESNSRFIVEVLPRDRVSFEKTLSGIPFAGIGEVNGTTSLRIKGLKGDIVITEDIARLKEAWKKPIRKVMHE